MKNLTWSQRLMMNRFKSLLSNDGLKPTTAIFPEIDHVAIAKSLQLTQKGKLRGEQNLPPTDTLKSDPVETEIISRIGDLRRQGLESYESNRRAYNGRLSRAEALHREFKIIAGRASGDFIKEIRAARTELAEPTEQLRDAYLAREDLREKYNLKRPARPAVNMFHFICTMIMVGVIESMLNAALFARGSDQGLLGGLMTATVFSFINIAIGVILGMFSRYMHHRNWLLKAFGLATLPLWGVIAGTLNLSLAHFRDLIQEGLQIDKAMMNAPTSLLAEPFRLNSLESWGLFGLGAIISFITFMKGRRTKDRIPDYSNREAMLAAARQTFDAQFQAAHDYLEEKRDDAIAELQETEKSVRSTLSDAIDAFHSYGALQGHLNTFLEQCDQKLAHLLALYRDENMAHRTDEPPKSFTLEHEFPTFVSVVRIDEQRRKDADAASKAIGSELDEAIKSIFETYNEAIQTLQLTEDIQGGPALTIKVQ